LDLFQCPFDRACLSTYVHLILWWLIIVSWIVFLL
jgi:hypothetical protein